MTKEQIAELEEGGSLMLCDDLWAKPLLRLLEERKRLLEALKQAVETLNQGPYNWPYTKAPEMWREALEFAEEAAR